MGCLIWVKRCALSVAIFAVAGMARAQTSIHIESPAQEAMFPEFSSPVMRVRVENGDSTVRVFAGVAGPAEDMLFYKYIAPTDTVEFPLTNLPPGKYEFGFMTRNVQGDYITTNLVFSVTNRPRAIPKDALTVLPGGSNTIPARINNKGQVVGVSGG